MADDTHKLQKDPPEGSRKTIEHELERQAGKTGEAARGSGRAEGNKDSGDPGSDGSKGRAKG
jgi:hypothetical protein